MIATAYPLLAPTRLLIPASIGNGQDHRTKRAMPALRPNPKKTADSKLIARPAWIGPHAHHTLSLRAEVRLIITLRRGKSSVQHQ